MTALVTVVFSLSEEGVGFRCAIHCTSVKNLQKKSTPAPKRTEVLMCSILVPVNIACITITNMEGLKLHGKKAKLNDTVEVKEDTMASCCLQKSYPFFSRAAHQQTMWIRDKVISPPF